eukprot:scaffold105568_cov37-Tisochrysis_lutea.AAC.3
MGPALAPGARAKGVTNLEVLKLFNFHELVCGGRGKCHERVDTKEDSQWDANRVCKPIKYEQGKVDETCTECIRRAGGEGHEAFHRK